MAVPAELFAATPAFLVDRLADLPAADDRPGHDESDPR